MRGWFLPAQGYNKGRSVPVDPAEDTRLNPGPVNSTTSTNTNTMKTPLILNLVWAGVAGAAFYTGYKLNADGDKDAGSKSTPVIAKNTTGPVGAGGPSKGVNPLLVSKDQTVIDFYKQYGLDSGVPLTPEKMKEAMLTAIRESDPVKSQLMFARLMEELTAENAPAALAMVRENVGGFDSMRYIGMLAYKWGEVDPVNAMAELSKSGDRRGGGMSQSIALTGWAAKDPKGAMAWLEAYEGEGREKEWMAMSLVNGLARSDADAALKYAAGLEDEGARRNAAESIAREMIRAGGVEKATAWLATLKDPEMMRGAFQTLSDQLLRSDPSKAAEFVKQYANEEYARGAIGNIADNLARKDVKQGLEFANSLTGKAQSRAIGSVVNEWLNQNDGAQALEASKYVESLPPGDSRDAGARAIANEVVRQDPATAIAWASSIQDAESRTEALVDVARRYMREDKAAATAWLATSGLSPEAQLQITNPQRGDWGGGFGGGGPGGGFDRGGGGRGNRGSRGGPPATSTAPASGGEKRGR